MTKTSKIAISLPEELLQGIDKERKTRGETRSEFLRRVIEVYLRRERDREAIEQYVRGYQQYPETEEELGWVRAASRSVLAAYPWVDSNAYDVEVADYH